MVLVLDRHLVVAGVFCTICLIIQLLTNNINPTGCVLMITGILGLSVSGSGLNVSRLWSFGESRQTWDGKPEDDVKAAQTIAGISEGEYTRVCQILEKTIYGVVLCPEQYETRTLHAFLHKIAMPKRQYGIKQYLKRRYLA